MVFVADFVYGESQYLRMWIAPFDGSAGGYINALIGFLMLVSTIFSLMGLVKPDIITKKNVFVAIIIVFIEVILCILLIGYAAVALDAVYWDPDVGFYGGIVSGIISLILYYLLLREF
ncbi:MAG: hypothetical protein JW891_18980 [Candidatus Lokiarchaeota archaeon]|nr:hypothetical protein [Candidatus Lokiarchaeota archaeon]